jgi:hypothetical protein
MMLNQVGWAGLMLGRIDLYFDDKKRKEIAKKSPNKNWIKNQPFVEYFFFKKLAFFLFDFLFITC